MNEVGVLSTMRSLQKAMVGHFGEPGTRSVHEIESSGVALSFIGYNQFDSGWSASTTVAQIHDARTQERIPVVFAHWGDEYKPANSHQKKLAHLFIDEGAELVIGAHPHVIQEHEMYKEKHIYYSLGNFIFDQYWNESVRTGIIATVSFDGAGTTGVREQLVALGRDRRTCVKGN